MLAHLVDAFKVFAARIVFLRAELADNSCGNADSRRFSPSSLRRMPAAWNNVPCTRREDARPRASLERTSELVVGYRTPGEYSRDKARFSCCDRLHLARPRERVHRNPFTATRRHSVTAIELGSVAAIAGARRLIRPRSSLERAGLLQARLPRLVHDVAPVQAGRGLSGRQSGMPRSRLERAYLLQARPSRLVVDAERLSSRRRLPDRKSLVPLI